MMTSKNSQKKSWVTRRLQGTGWWSVRAMMTSMTVTKTHWELNIVILQQLCSACHGWLLLKSYELTHCSVCGRNNKPKLSWLDISSPALCLLESCSKLHLRHKMLQKCCQWSELVVTDSERAYWCDSLWIEWCTEVTLAIQDTFEDDDYGDHDDKDNDREKKHSERKNSRAWCHDLWDVWSEWTLRITSLTFIVTPQLNGQHS